MTPDQHTIQEFFLGVSDGHQLYVHEWGNPKAKNTVIFLHGGPGGQCKDGHRKRFDPARHHVIFFDQRGCGRSLPYGSLQHNTTDELIQDITAIAEYFKCRQFVLAGGSWGSCLALAYALKHPRRVKSMVLNGIFTGSHAECEWLLNGGFRATYPDVWDDFLARTPKEHHRDPAGYHLKRIAGASEQAARQSAYAYLCLEAGIMSLDDRFTPPDPIAFDPAGIKIEIMYLTKNLFMPDRHILANAHKLTMPVWLVQGRYDMDCPPKTAYELHQKLPNSHLIWTIGGHHGSEHETATALRTILLNIA